jgi:hypothetical protein
VLGNLEEEMFLVPGTLQLVAFTIRFTSKTKREIVVDRVYLKIT